MHSNYALSHLLKQEQDQLKQAERTVIEETKLLEDSLIEVMKSWGTKFQHYAAAESISGLIARSLYRRGWRLK